MSLVKSLTNFIIKYFQKNDYTEDIKVEKKENNLHIKKYFDNYLKSEKSEFAVLLTAKWGTGKTFFISEYIEDYKKDSKKEECKFIKISLFGISDLKLIDEKIYQQIHPVLGHKYVKFAGGILKNGVKLGIPNIDFNGDNKSDLNVNFDMKSNFDDYFSKNKSKKKLVFIFDDLERTKLDFRLFLGYINSILEELQYKIIIITDEKKLEDKEYIEFKEKVIGKTFELQQEDIHSIIKTFVEEYSNKTKNILNENIETLIDVVCKNNDSINLRVVKQSIMAFEYSFEYLEDKFVENKEFIKQLIKNYFILSKELKTRIFNNQEENEKSKIVKCIDILNENEINQHIFTNDIWSDILIKSYLDKDILKANIESTAYFIKKRDEPSWYKLWHFRKLNDDEFNLAFADMKDKFIKNNYTNETELFHVIALLIFFYKEKLSEYSIDSIEKQIDINVSLLKTKEKWGEKLFNKNNIIFGGFGLGFMNSNDVDFVKIYNKILEENEKYFYNQKVLKDKDELELFLKSIRDGDENYLKSFFSEKYQDIPILKDLDTTKFVNSLYECPNKGIQFLREILSSRYADNYLYAGEKKYCRFLTKEKDFWINVNELIDNYKYDEKLKLKNYMIKEDFNRYVVKNTIEKLNNC